MSTVTILLRQAATLLDSDGQAVEERGHTVRVQPRPDRIDLDRLSPRARQLAEAVAASPLHTAATIWVESDAPIREQVPNWKTWYSAEEANRPLRQPWSAWSQFRATDTTDPHDWLERQAAKIPAGWHVLGASPHAPLEGREDDMTTAQVIAELGRNGVHIKAGTWRAYVARGQAPARVRKVGPTPLWAPGDIADWLRERPGPGARTDITQQS